jgi:hypothetical protein
MALLEALPCTVFTLGSCTLHQIHAAEGRVFAMGEVASELFNEGPAAFLAVRCRVSEPLHAPVVRPRVAPPVGGSGAPARDPSQPASQPASPSPAACRSCARGATSR